MGFIFIVFVPLTWRRNISIDFSVLSLDSEGVDCRTFAMNDRALLTVDLADLEREVRDAVGFLFVRRGN